MKKIPRYISRSISGVLPEKWLLKRQFPVFLPFYHMVSNEKLPYILNYPYRNEKEFEKELDFYLKHFQAAGLEEVVSPGHTGGKMFHISFDDGLRQCADVVAPLLLRKGIPATFFINTAFIDNTKLFHRYKASLILSQLRQTHNQKVNEYLEKENLAGEKILQASIYQEEILNEAARMLEFSFTDFLNRQQPYMSSEQVKKLASEGFCIGAHSHTHPEFYEISAAEQLSEVRESMARVVQLVKPRLKVFSFPFTDSGVPATLLKTIQQENLCDFTFGTAGIKKDSVCFHIQRYPAEQPGDFIRNLKGEIVYYFMRAWSGKGTVTH
ncbi:MAG: polysaccharide deacetylase family protein [Prolixibacteraceae bacterium]